MTVLIMLMVQRSGGDTQDVVTLRTRADVAPQVDAWARRNGYERRPDPRPGHRRYQKGKGGVTNPRIIDLVQDAQGQHLVAFHELGGLGKKRRLAMTHKGFPRVPKRALTEFNDLLAAVGEPALG